MTLVRNGSRQTRKSAAKSHIPICSAKHLVLPPVQTFLLCLPDESIIQKDSTLLLPYWTPMKICRPMTYEISGQWMVIRLLTVSTAHALPARIGLVSIGSVGDQLCWCHRWWLLYTPRTNGRVRGGGSEGGEGFWRRCCSTVGQMGRPW